MVALVAGVLAVGERLVHLFADALADRGALLQSVIVAAGIQRRGHEEDRLCADQRDGGTGRIYQRRGLFPYKFRRGRRSLLSFGRVGGAAGGLGKCRGWRKAGEKAKNSGR